MKTVICFGEALIDFINTNKHAEGPLTLNEFSQYPGGAPANVAVAIAKLGGEAMFVGQVGQDMFGDFLKHALSDYGVNTRYMVRHPSAKTALAFVLLDEDGECSFSFYRDNTADVIFASEQINNDCFNGGAIFHCCSNTLTNKGISATTNTAVALATKRELLISFDVNLRHNLWPNEQVNIARVNNLAKQADVLKYSKDELTYLAQSQDDAYIEQLLSQGVALILVTDGGGIIHYYSQTDSGIISPPQVKAVDTTAGGDAFIGGFLYGLSQVKSPKATLRNEEKFMPLIHFAAKCGAHAVTQYGAFPALPTLTDVTI